MDEMYEIVQQAKYRFLGGKNTFVSLYKLQGLFHSAIYHWNKL